MKFSQIPYIRPDFNQVICQVEGLKKQVLGASNPETVANAYIQMENLYHEFSTSYTVCSLRYFANTTDEFYKNEFQLFAANLFTYSNAMEELNKRFLESTFLPSLKEKFGEKTFKLMEFDVLLNNPETIGLKTDIKIIEAQYDQWMSQASFDMEGTTVNYMGLMPYFSSYDRTVRKKTYQIVSDAFFADNKKVGDWFSELVQLRNEVARKSNFPSYSEYSYLVHRRMGYTIEDVGKFRKGVSKYFKQVAATIESIRIDNTGLTDSKIYDEKIFFTDGNPKPVGTDAELMAKAQQMYRQLAPQTDQLFSMMKENELMDIENRPKKIGGGFATKMPVYQFPYIFTSFTGTDFDFRVLTHEFGHTFQFAYGMRSGRFNTSNPTLDCIETYSHAMEFLTYPWVPLFFEKDANKFYLKHLIDTASLITSCCIGDEFQELIYKKNLLSDEERNMTYLEVKNKYQTPSDYDGIEYYRQGNAWKMVTHYFKVPFYYIDYAYACVMALQIYKIMKEDYQKAWEIYLKICEQCAGLTLAEMVEQTGLKSPFEEATIEELAGFMQTEITLAYQNYKSTKP
jgi:M3 family oligoendopeptidase